MSATGYRVLGFTVWHGAKWYLRRRLPSSRVLALSGLSAVAALAGAAVVARRLAS